MANQPVGSFVPTSNIWDVARIEQVNVNSDEFKELLVRLYQNVNLISINLNLKDTGYYDTRPYVCGRLLFPNPTLNSQTSSQAVYRSSTRLTVNFGALPASGVKSVPHGIYVDSSLTWTRIEGVATDTVGLTGIDLSDVNATIVVTSTNVVITTTTDLSNYNVTYIYLEYINN